MNGRIVVPVDGSDLALCGLHAAIDLAKAVDASIEIAYVVDITKAAAAAYGDPQYVAPCLEALRDDGKRIVQTAFAEAANQGVSAAIRLLEGNPAEAIVELAREPDVRWIVMASHGRSGLGRLLLGSVAEGVLRRSSVPVVVVPMPHRARTSAA
ncbi:MAG: universal stress protein [Candidatus Eremiobacteraeota bacterium]|nr:universal stress protein [Candidatus Eremiobacteraeota bacterium]